jgi:hypothetical protein
VIVIVAVRVPLANGRNVIEYEHVDIAAKLAPQVLARPIVKSPESAPLRLSLSEIEAVWLFVTLRVFVLLPKKTATVPNDSEAGEMVTGVGVRVGVGVGVGV